MNAKACHINVTSFDLSKAMTFSKIFSKVKLSPSARLVLRCLVDFYNPKKGLVYPGQKTISECTGASLKSVNSAIDELRKAGLILTSGSTGERLKYYFSNTFFEIVGITQGYVKTSQEPYVKITHHEQHETKQINNKNKVLNFQKADGVKYKSPETTREEINDSKGVKSSPLDFTRDEAIKWLNGLPVFAQNGYFAKELKKKWNL